MINYTERITDLMRDIVGRVPRLSQIDPDCLLVFARYGRARAEGAFATCHCMSLPPTEPGYFYWQDRRSGRVTRRSRWFVTKCPSVRLGGRRIDYLLSFAIPRFCDESMAGSRKACHYGDVPPWFAKLDTIVHELYHIDPHSAGIRAVFRSDGTAAAGSHGRVFLTEVAGMVREYMASGPDPATYDFLRYDFAELCARFGGVLGTTFRTFPSFPQRYIEELPAAAQPETPAAVPIQPLRATAGPTRFTEADLVVRQFLERATRRVQRRESRAVGRPHRRVQVPGESRVPRAAATSPRVPAGPSPRPGGVGI